MNVVAIVQARMGSTRLPGKVLKPIGGLPALEHTYRRVCEAAKYCPLRGVVVTIPDTPEDQPLFDWLKIQQFGHVRANDIPQDDVLRRYAIAASLTEADIVVRITGDCPFICPDSVAGVVNAVVRHPACTQRLYYCNTQVRMDPHGHDVEVFTYRMLMDVNATATEPYNREHVTPAMKKGLAPAMGNPDQPDLSHHRWVLDTPDDYAWFCRIAEEIDVTPPHPTTEELLDLIAQKPELGHYEKGRAP